MNKIYFFFLILLSACVPENRMEELSGLKAVYNQLNATNTRGLMRMEKMVADNGNRIREVEYIDQYKNLSSKRSGIILNDSLFDDYFQSLTKAYSNSDEYFDSSKLKESTALYNLWKEKSDSLIFYNCLLNLVLIESDIMKYVGSRLEGNCSFGYFADINKEKDTITQKEQYSIAVSPTEYFFGKSFLKLNSDLQFKHNGIIKKVQYTIDNPGGLIIIKVDPSDKGEYYLSGECRIFKRGDTLSFPFKFKDRFYVK